jgi:hypothetical protein
MSNEQLIDKAYDNYKNSYHPDSEKIFQYEGSTIEVRIMTKEEFVDMVKTDYEFSDKWGLKIEEIILSDERRYHIWFTNNYETGMERHFDPNNIPKFDDPYYEPTPTKLTRVIYTEKIESYE